MWNLKALNPGSGTWLKNGGNRSRVPCVPAIIHSMWNTAVQQGETPGFMVFQCESTDNLRIESLIVKRTIMPAAYIENIGVHEGNGNHAAADGYTTSAAAGNCNLSSCAMDTGIIQCVAFKGNFSPEQFEALDKLTQESSIEIQGKIRKDSRSPGGYRAGCYGIRDCSADRATIPSRPRNTGRPF